MNSIIRTGIKFLALAALAASAQAATLSFTTFISGSQLDAAVGASPINSQGFPIGLAYAGDRFVGSANYSTGTQLYQANLDGSNVRAFGAPLTGFSGEIFVASSLSTGAYGSNEIYAGAENGGRIVRLSHDGTTQSNFVTGLDSGVRSIAFDPSGLYGNSMIVATHSGKIYKIDSSGTPTVLADLHEDAEGITFSNTAFGGFPVGTLFICSEGSGAIRAITPTGTVSYLFSIAGAESISFIPNNIGQSGNPVEGFYGVSYPNDIQFASANQFTAYAGHVLVTSETTHDIYDVSSTGVGQFAINYLGDLPAQPEDSIFVTAEAVQQHAAPDGASTVAMLGSVLLAFTALRRRSA